MDAPKRKWFQMNEANWSEVLDQLSASLDEASTELSRHEQTLASPLLASDPSAEHHVAWQQSLERFGERIQQFRQSVRRSEEAVAHAESAIMEREMQIQDYQRRLDEVRRQLANVPAAAIE